RSVRLEKADEYHLPLLSRPVRGRHRAMTARLARRGLSAAFAPRKRIMMKHARLSWVGCLLRLLAVVAAAQQPLQLETPWPTMNGALGASRYSPLDQIDATNVAGLVEAWRV